jgi:Na+/proline symporter
MKTILIFRFSGFISSAPIRYCAILCKNIGDIKIILNFESNFNIVLMSLTLILTVFSIYTVLLLFVSWFTSRKADIGSYAIGNKKSKWFVVAYGMVGTSISGVTMISVPGNVMNQSFFYMPMVLGFLVGYAAVALVLLPIYYHLNLTSI